MGPHHDVNGPCSCGKCGGQLQVKLAKGGNFPGQYYIHVCIQLRNGADVLNEHEFTPIVYSLWLPLCLPQGRPSLFSHSFLNRHPGKRQPTSNH
jgi:hypothetical protein